MPLLRNNTPVKTRDIAIEARLKAARCPPFRTGNILICLHHCTMGVEGSFDPVFRSILLLLTFVVLAGKVQASCSRPLIFGHADYAQQSSSNFVSDGFTFDIDILAGIMAAAGCEFDLVALPANRLQAAIARGQVDGKMWASITPSRQEYANFIGPYRKEWIVPYMVRDKVKDFRGKNTEALFSSPLKIGVMLGFWYGPSFEAYQRSASPNSILTTSDGGILYTWLLTNRADVVLEDLYFGNFLLKSKGLHREIYPLNIVVNENDVYMMLSKKSVSDKDREIISKGLKRYKTSSAYPAMLSRFITDYPCIEGGVQALASGEITDCKQGAR